MNNNQLARRPQPQPLAALPKNGIVTIGNQRYQVQLTPALKPVQLPIKQHRDERPATYQTMQSRGHQPQQLKLPTPPSPIALVSSAIIALTFLVAASMFSISLTAYSNSVDRVNTNRSIVEVQ